jgi:hypothetical protein
MADLNFQKSLKKCRGASENSGKRSLRMSKVDLDLLFQAKTYPVPRKCVFELLDHHRNLMDAKIYRVRSSVPFPVFETFIDSLKSQSKPTITLENADSLSLLAKEFFLPELAQECAASAVDPISLLSARVSKLERQMSYLGHGRVEDLDSQERRLERVRKGLESLETALGSLDGKQSLMEGLVRQIERTQGSLRQEVEQLKRGGASSAVSPQHRGNRLLRDQRLIEAIESQHPHLPQPRRGNLNLIPMTERESTDGIIAYLTKKHGGNVHDLGIVTLTVKSLRPGHRGDPANAADLDRSTWWLSGNKNPGQWICWDFGTSRVHLTHYTLSTQWLASWIVEGSLDGETWTELDRQSDRPQFTPKSAVISFSISDPTELRFIRLTQTGERSNGGLTLGIRACEFFGTLLDPA